MGYKVGKLQQLDSIKTTDYLVAESVDEGTGLVMRKNVLDDNFVSKDEFEEFKDEVDDSFGNVKIADAGSSSTPVYISGGGC